MFPNLCFLPGHSAKNCVCVCSSRYKILFFETCCCNFYLVFSSFPHPWIHYLTTILLSLISVLLHKIFVSFPFWKWLRPGAAAEFQYRKGLKVEAKGEGWRVLERFAQESCFYCSTWALLRWFGGWLLGIMGRKSFGCQHQTTPWLYPNWMGHEH